MNYSRVQTRAMKMMPPFGGNIFMMNDSSGSFSFYWKRRTYSVIRSKNSYTCVRPPVLITARFMVHTNPTHYSLMSSSRPTPLPQSSFTLPHLFSFFLSLLITHTGTCASRKDIKHFNHLQGDVANGETTTLKSWNACWFVASGVA